MKFYRLIWPRIGFTKYRLNKVLSDEIMKKCRARVTKTERRKEKLNETLEYHEKIGYNDKNHAEERYQMHRLTFTFTHIWFTRSTALSSSSCVIEFFLCTAPSSWFDFSVAFGPSVCVAYLHSSGTIKMWPGEKILRMPDLAGHPWQGIHSSSFFEILVVNFFFYGSILRDSGSCSEKSILRWWCQ